MLPGLILIISGLLSIFLQKTSWHKSYVEKHNFTEVDDFLQFMRNVVGGVLIFIGIIFLFA
jgi:hypothetical protein